MWKLHYQRSSNLPESIPKHTSKQPYSRSSARLNTKTRVEAIWSPLDHSDFRRRWRQSGGQKGILTSRAVVTLPDLAHRDTTWPSRAGAELRAGPTGRRENKGRGDDVRGGEGGRDFECLCMSYLTVCASAAYVFSTCLSVKLCL